MRQSCQKLVLATVGFLQARLAFTQSQRRQLLFGPRSINRFFRANSVRDVSNDRQVTY